MGDKFDLKIAVFGAGRLPTLNPMRWMQPHPPTHLETLGKLYANTGVN